jgi:predicted  nucleic acid-binding Zn-ribbon protein
MPQFTIQQYESFITTAQGSVSELFREIAEVQEALNDAREHTRLSRRDLIEQCRKLLSERSGGLDATFESTLEAKRTEYVHSLEAEAAALKEVVTKGEAQSEEYLQLVRVLRDELRKLNPELDAQEEALKQEVVGLESQVAALDDRIAHRARWFGSFTHRAEIRELGKQLEQLDARLTEAEKSLGQVREQWKTKAAKAAGEDTELQASWSANELRAARLRQDLSLLTDDLAAEAERRALFALVDGAAVPPPTGDAEVDRVLAEVDKIADTLADQEGALAAGSEMLGMLKGLGEGLDGFRKAIASVVAEQEGHSELPQLRVDVPDDAAAFHAVWPELARYVVDEKQMAAFPGHFLRALRQLLDERLTPAGIERMFNELGDALTRATERWSA